MRTLFKPSASSIIERGLESMTICNEALQEINRNLAHENAKLSSKVANLTERVVTDSIEKE